MIGIGIGREGLVVTSTPDDTEENIEMEEPTSWNVHWSMGPIYCETLREAQVAKSELRGDGFSGRIKAVYADGEERDVWDLR